MSANAETVIVARTPVRETRRSAPSSPSAPRRPSTRPTPNRRSTQARRAAQPNRFPSTPTPATPDRPRPKRARTGVFAAFVLMILTVGLLGMLWINTSLAQGAFTLTDLQQQRTQLLEVEQQLAEQLARAESPAQVELAARALGMVPQDVPVFVRLSDGQIIGDPIPQPEPVPVEAPATIETIETIETVETVETVDSIEGDVVVDDPVVDEQGGVTP